MTTETYEIVAIKYGEFAGRRRADSFIMADDHDAPHPIAYYVWRRGHGSTPGTRRAWRPFPSRCPRIVPIPCGSRDS